MRLTDKQWQTVENALTVAAERFKEDAKVCIEAGHARLAEQFNIQEADSRALATLVMDRGVAYCGHWVAAESCPHCKAGRAQ